MVSVTSVLTVCFTQQDLLEAVSLLVHTEKCLKPLTETEKKALLCDVWICCSALFSDIKAKACGSQTLQ